MCKAYTPGKPDQDIHLRLARLEHIIEVALPQFASGSGITFKDQWPRERVRSFSPDADTGSHSQAEEDDFGSGTFQSGKWYGTSASGSVAPASVLQQVKMVDYPFLLETDYRIQLQNAVTGSPANPPISDDKKTFVATIDSVPQDSEPTAADNLKTLIQDCGVSPHKITELVQELPPRRFADVLIDFYFASV